MNDTAYWQGAYDIEIAAAPAAIWAMFREAFGAGADEIGPAVSSDFPDVLEGLALALTRV